MITENMRVLVRGDKPDHELIGQVVRVITAEDLLDATDLPGRTGDSDKEVLDQMNAMHITHIAAIMTGSPCGTIAMFKMVLRDGEWYLMNGEHLTVEQVGVCRG